MTVYPFIFHLGPLEITGYGIMLMVAFLMGGWLIARQLRENQLKEDYAADIVAAAVIGGIGSIPGAMAGGLLMVGATELSGPLLRSVGDPISLKPGEKAATCVNRSPFAIPSESA